MSWINIFLLVVLAAALTYAYFLVQKAKDNAKEIERSAKIRAQMDLEERRKQNAEITAKEVKDAIKSIENDLEQKKIGLMDKVNQQIKNETEIAQMKAKELIDKYEKERATHEVLIATAKAEQESVNRVIGENIRTHLAAELGRIKIDPQDRDEIQRISKIISTFRNPTPFRKALFDYYYSSPARQMISSITERRRIGGVYKITHVPTGQAYIGQSVDIDSRWWQHIRRGVGSEDATSAALYPAMMKYGVEEFKFEILEETDKLREREKFWIEFYDSNNIGFNRRVG